jgi:hypothetical protein
MIGISLAICHSIIAGGLEVDLNGFRLRQNARVPEAALGRSVHSEDTGKATVQVHPIDDDAYLVFTFSKSDPHFISAIQLTGSTKKALPFKGLVLGDDVEKINRTLGQPARVVDVEPRLSKYSYDANYSLEIAEGRLHSIRIFTTTELMSKAGEPGPDWAEFKSAVLAGDFSRIAAMLRPDVEVQKDGKVLSITQRYKDFVDKPDKAFRASILEGARSVLAALKQSEPEGDMRIAQHLGVGQVYKFHKGTIVKEISFFPFNGKLRVYEIIFR